ncbi:unnamed protein product [Prorocentrum cordatum]|uniref:Uncharacterized protein n=1 Tax=Prorocentrum cordatum TaxID=2364126 RepID=A0ABN9Q123_9DINO|nr:unnamed protein product [Polarella glacialis]
MPSTARRPAALPALLLALGAAALLSSPGAFLPAPAPARPAGVDAAALGAASGLLVATDAAHANGSQLFGARYTGLISIFGFGWAVDIRVLGEHAPLQFFLLP